MLPVWVFATMMSNTTEGFGRHRFGDAMLVPRVIEIIYLLCVLFRPLRKHTKTHAPFKQSPAWLTKFMYLFNLAKLDTSMVSSMGSNPYTSTLSPTSQRHAAEITSASCFFLVFSCLRFLPNVCWTFHKSLASFPRNCAVPQLLDWLDFSKPLSITSARNTALKGNCFLTPGHRSL